MNLRICVAAMLLLLGAPAAASVLRVETLIGEARAQRGGASAPLTAGFDLAEGDVLSVAPGARLTLGLGRHGFLDLGAGSLLTVERLPFSSYAGDLQTVLRLGHGYLRVSWKYPEVASRWPLVLYLAGYSAELAGGEYFFEAGEARRTACVSSGKASLAGAPLSAVLTGPACYRLPDGAMPEPRRRDFADFIAARERFALGDLPERAAAPGPEITIQARAAPAAVPAAIPGAAPAALPAITASSAPAPVAPPATPSAASAVSADRWTIVVASYPGEPEAAAHAARLRRGGHVPLVEAAQVKGKTWYRVQVRDIAGKAQAQRLLDELKAAGESDGAWLVHQR
ncbi:MAG TPA: SPOR domain-containing protein [Solimonas sp.]|nr:SPOR domain-containing protein [Solimonas sp.]